MSLPIECINIVVQAKSIESHYPGGFGAWVADDSAGYGYVWDEHLYRFGAMNDLAASLAISRLDELGLRGQIRSRGKKQWADYCVFGDPGALRGCDWLVLDFEEGLMSHRDAGPVAANQLC